MDIGMDQVDAILNEEIENESVPSVITGLPTSNGLECLFSFVR